jgi:hypothetical protein
LSNRRKILIVSRPDDGHVRRVAKILAQKGASFLLLDEVDLQSTTAAAYRISDGRARTIQVSMPNESFCLDDVGAVWYRRPTRPMARKGVADRTREAVAAGQLRGFIFNLWACCSSALWCPGAPAQLGHCDLKLLQLEAARRLRLSIPPTLVTNDPKELTDFYNEHSGQIIRKALAGESLTRTAPAFAFYTQPVTTRDMARLGDVSLSPMIFQARVPKKCELRVTVVGERVFTAEIGSQASRRTQQDWRRYDLASTPHRATEIPRDIEDACIKLVRSFGLTYAAIDFIVTPQDQFVFLEINCNGQYGWVETLTRLRISEAIAELLIKSTAGPTTVASPLAVSLEGRAMYHASRGTQT